MKVLATCVPQAGHLNPMLPLISAMVAGGDEVLVATGPAVREQVERVGGRFEPAGHDMEVWFGRLAARTRGAPGDGLAPPRIPHYFTPRLFAEIAADDVVEDLLAAGRQLEPDLVLFEPAAFAAPLVARLLDARQAQQMWGPLTAPDVLQLSADAVSPLWRSFGLDVPEHAGIYEGDTIALCPPSMEPLALPKGRQLLVRPAPLPLRPGQPHEPPLVYFSLGTMWAAPTVVQDVLDALGDLPVRVVATLGRLDPAKLARVPANVEVKAFVPQDQLLPDASLVVHHAGGGTMFGALAHGLPQVALPQAADNFINAELLARNHLAITLQPHELDLTAVAAAVVAVLEDPKYADAAGAVAAEIAGMPAPEEVVEQLRAG